MRKVIMLSIVALAIVLSTSSCTENQRAKNWGGNAQVELPAGRKVVNATWKDADLWILTRAAKPGETPETFQFSEKSTWGLLNGNYTIIEK